MASKSKSVAESQIYNVQTDTTGAFDLPAGTTAQRPGSPTSGNIRYNTTIGAAELYDGTAWERVDKAVPTITSVNGNIYDGVVGGGLTVTGFNFLSGAGTFNFSDAVNGVDEDVSVTPTSDVQLSVAVPAAVYNTSGVGSEVLIKFTNSEGTVGAAFSMTVVGFPTGGTIVTSGNYRYHTFTSTNNFVTPVGWTSPVEYLIIAGGGGGGNDLAGAGGAGGLLNGTTSNLAQSSTYQMTVGTGGAGGSGSRGSSTSDGTQGVNSSGFSQTAIGGGKGGSYWDGGVTASRSAGGDGGSGGGGSGVGSNANPNPAPGGSGTSGQGNNGGAGLFYPYSSPLVNYHGGGGGGAGGVGAAAASDGSGGTGGAGSSAYSAWGTATSTGENVSGTRWFAGGGGGGRYNHTSDGQAPGGNGGGGQGGMGVGTGSTNRGEDATDGTGGGGGAGTWTGSVASVGGAGGDGIIIVRYNLTTLG